MTVTCERVREQITALVPGWCVIPESFRTAAVWLVMVETMLLAYAYLGTESDSVPTPVMVEITLDCDNVCGTGNATTAMTNFIAAVMDEPSGQVTVDVECPTHTNTGNVEVWRVITGFILFSNVYVFTVSLLCRSRSEPERSVSGSREQGTRSMSGLPA